MAHKKIIYTDIDNLYAESAIDNELEWSIYTKNDEYIGYVLVGKNQGIVYPESLNDEPAWWIMRPLYEVGNNLKNAVRFIYLNYKKLSTQNKQLSEEKKIKKGDVTKTVYVDIDGFNTTRLGTTDILYVETREGEYVGAINNQWVKFPEDISELHKNGAGNWTGGIERHKRGMGNIKNAVRYIYLNWKKINQQNDINKIRKIVREIYMGNDWAEPEWWTKNKWGKDSPGPDPFSPDALGSAVGSAMNTTAEGEENIISKEKPTQYFIGERGKGIMTLDRDRNNPVIKNGKEYLRINNIIVPEKLRNTGVASNLYKMALEKAKSEGFGGIVSDSGRIEDKTGAIKKIHKNFNATKQKYEIDLGAKPREVTFIEAERKTIPEGGYWKNGGDEPLFPEPFSNDALGWDFMPESIESIKQQLKLKYKRPSDKYFGNTVIFLNDNEIGYMMPIRSKFATIGDNFHIQFNYNGNHYNRAFINRNKAIEFLKTTLRVPKIPSNRK